MKGTAIAIVCFLLLAAAPAGGFEGYTGNLTKEEKLLTLNGAALLFITGWGIAFWDYGQNPPRTSDEQWFQSDSDEGGADKLGHFYSSYAVCSGFSSLFESWGYEPKEAAAYGALSSFGLLGFMELGDSFSDYGFSYSDLIMNALGTCAGYLRSTYPEVARKIDFRLEYVPDLGDAGDFITAYERMKFLAAVKLSGFDFVTNKYLKYLELHLGYYARGYSDDNEGNSRHLYAGIGINVAQILSDLSFKKTSKIFNYYQLPYTYISTKKNFDD